MTALQLITILASLVLTAPPTAKLNPTLVDLPDNTWVRLNPKPSKRWIPVWGEPEAEQKLIATREPRGRNYTGIVHGDGKIFYFGGAHYSWPGNDVEVYDIAENAWHQSYKPEVPPRNDPVYGSGGSEHLSPTGKPYCIHGYSRTSYHVGLKRYVCTATYSLASYDPVTRKWEYLSGKHAPGGKPPMPRIDDLTQWDSGLGGLLGIRGREIWLFKNGVWTKHDQVDVSLARSGGSASVYIPGQQAHLFAAMPHGGKNATAHLYLYDSIKKKIKEITSAPPALSRNFVPLGNFVMACDTINRKVISLTTEDGRIVTWVYDAAADTWTKLSPTDTAPPHETFSPVSREPFQYEPTHNAFILLLNKGGGRSTGRVQTWAYRYTRAKKE